PEQALFAMQLKGPQPINDGPVSGWGWIIQLSSNLLDHGIEGLARGGMRQLAQHRLNITVLANQCRRIVRMDSTSRRLTLHRNLVSAHKLGEISEGHLVLATTCRGRIAHHASGHKDDFELRTM